MGKGFFGDAVAEMREVKGDGASDHLVGASGETAGETKRPGRANLISGADGGTLRVFEAPNPTES